MDDDLERIRHINGRNEPCRLKRSYERLQVRVGLSRRLDFCSTRPTQCGDNLVDKSLGGFWRCQAEGQYRCGNKEICRFTVTVKEGGSPPGIQCPADLTLTTCSNTAVLTYPPPVVNPLGTPFVCLPPPGTIVPLGVHTVTCIASNACGQTRFSTCRLVSM